MADNQENIVVLSQLEIGSYEFRFSLDNTYFHAITPSELLGGETAVVAKLNLRESDFSLRMAVEGMVQVTCDRCLDPMDVDIDVEDEVDVEQDAEQLDLSWLAYEMIIVNLPLVHSHQPGGCNPAMELLLQNHLCTELEEPEA